MTTSVINFISYCWRQLWRYGYSKIYKIVVWTKNNWRTVARWITAGVPFAEILRRIISIVF